MTLRLYGNAPYTVAALHGDPGAAGSVGYLASELSKRAKTGVLEPVQSAESIEGQVAELSDLLADFNPKVLIGHSWGAWLALFYAAKYHNVSKLILIGCPPFEAKAAEEKSMRRLKALSPSDFKEFKRCAVLAQTGDKDAFSRLGELADKADNVCLPDPDPSLDFLLPFCENIYEKVWSQADLFRKNNGFETLLKEIDASVYVLQGDKDPHLASDAVLPLRRAGLDVREFIFENCGHSPFREKYVKDRFFNVLTEIIHE